LVGQPADAGGQEIAARYIALCLAADRDAQLRKKCAARNSATPAIIALVIGALIVGIYLAVLRHF